MASEDTRRTLYHAQNAERSFHLATANLREVKSQLHGWEDSVGAKAYDCYDRIYTSWKNKGTEDITALKETAQRLAHSAENAQAIENTLKELSVLVADMEEVVNRG